VFLALHFSQSLAAIANYYRMYVEMFDEQLLVPKLRQIEIPPRLLLFGSDDAERNPPLIKIILD
jgi:hypothetical protein